MFYRIRLEEKHDVSREGEQGSGPVGALAPEPQACGPRDAPRTPEQPRNPLHGLTLATIVEELAAQYGWEELALQIRIQCFANEPSVKSSLKFLRRTPWAREKVESFYLWHLRELKRRARQG